MRNDSRDLAKYGGTSSVDKYTPHIVLLPKLLLMNIDKIVLENCRP